MVDGRSTAIIGVLPEGFRFPEGEDSFWQPLEIDPARSTRSQTYLRTMGRLADGATIERVQQQMNQVAEDLEKQFPDSNSGYRVALAPAATAFTRSARRIITVLGLTAIAIFLLACTNIASLVIVRTAGGNRSSRSVLLSARTPRGCLDN